MLRSFVRHVLAEALKKETSFDQWLSPDVMEVLIDKYAAQGPEHGILQWEYKPLRPGLWGEFISAEKKLYVNKTHTKGEFKQQVSTILHEIQHWNQYVEATKDVPTSRPGASFGEFGMNRAHTWGRLYRAATNRASSVLDIELPPELQARLDMLSPYQREVALARLEREMSKHAKYENNEYEVDARAFAARHLDEAMAAIGRHYSGKVEGGELDDVIEELFDEYEEGTPLTRLQVGTALRDWDLNTPENMKKVLAALKDLGVAIQGFGA